MEINLVVVWALIIIFGLTMYVLSDGFDLGVGVLFLAAPNSRDRDAMLRSVTKRWDGSEAWLALVAVCFAIAFPPTLSVMWAAFSIPLLGMLFGLMIRGIAFKKRADNRGRWDALFCFGSILVTFLQGAILGALIQGTAVEGQRFVGNQWDWLTWFSALTGLTLLLTYALLGATWLLVTTEGALYKKMRRHSHHLLVWFGYAMTIVMLVTPFLNEAQRERWLGLPNLFHMGFVPMLGVMAFVWVYYVIRFSEWRRWPFAITLIMLWTAFFTYITSLWPNIIIPNMSIYEMAGQANLGQPLWGILLFVLAILAYSFRAFKSSFDNPQLV